MPKRKAEHLELAPARKERFYYDRHRLNHCLQHICPRSLPQFPDASTFKFFNAVSDDGLRQYRALEIGLVWPVDLVRRARGIPPEKLFVVDKGAYDSDAPELVPYTERGCLQHSIVEADGFMPTGLFMDFARMEGCHMVKPKLKDPLVLALIQYIFIIQDMRRYYFNPTPHDAPMKAQLATLAEALDRVTLGRGSNCRPPTLTLDRTAASAWLDLRAPGSSGVNPKRGTVPFTVARPHRKATDHANTDRDRADSVTSNSTWPNEFGQHPQVLAKDIIPHRAPDGETSTANSAPDKSTPDKFVLVESTSGVEQSESQPCPNTRE